MTFNEVKDLIQEQCNLHDVIFFHAESTTITFGPIESNGFFADGYYDGEEYVDISVLAVGSNSNTLKTMVHEYCHLLQSVEGYEPYVQAKDYNFIWEWVARNPITDEIPLDVIDEALITYYTLEVDAERRSVEKHIEWDTGIDIEEYIQQSNAYTLFYFYVRENRVWYTPGKEPYVIEDVWKQMPKTFDFDPVQWYLTHHKLFDLCV